MTGKLQAILQISLLAFWAADEFSCGVSLLPRWARAILITVLFVGMAHRIWLGNVAVGQSERIGA